MSYLLLYLLYHIEGIRKITKNFTTKEQKLAPFPGGPSTLSSERRRAEYSAAATQPRSAPSADYGHATGKSLVVFSAGGVGARSGRWALLGFEFASLEGGVI